MAGTLDVTTWLSNPHGAGPFPEFQLGGASDRYLPAKRPIGVCISGGGCRSFSSAIGQLRAMHDFPGFMDLVGAISSVSGGTWFNTVYHYADAEISDETLLGPMTAPTDLTMAQLTGSVPGFAGHPLQYAHNDLLLDKVADITGKILAGDLPQDRLWSRLLNDLYWVHFGFGDVTRSFSLTGGGPLNAYAMRADRPYFIANATQVQPTGEHAVMRHFEYTPLYSGTSSWFANVGPGGEPFGGGYIDSSAFDSRTPISTNPVRVATPNPLFTLSDLAGSSSAAPEETLNRLGIHGDGFPLFHYWPPVQPQSASVLYPFADGGSLEDLGIVPLLRRQYPRIIAFVNAELKIGSTSGQAVSGISEQVSRLFGQIPSDRAGNNQDTQVFGADKTEGGILFQRLVDGLTATQNSGAVFTDRYTITPSNNFTIQPYPQYAPAPWLGSGQVQVTWVYLNLNTDWMAALQRNPDPAVPALLQSTADNQNFVNFPHYRTFGQNRDVLGLLPEPLQLTPAQVELMANMTAYSLTGGDGRAAMEEVVASVA